MNVLRSQVLCFDANFEAPRLKIKTFVTLVHEAQSFEALVNGFQGFAVLFPGCFQNK